MLSLQALTKSYPTPHGRRYVFRNLSFEFPQDVSIGLIGRNGAGKSTLMRLLGGTDLPDSGRILTDKRISWPVGLSGGFQGSLTGRDNVRFVCRIYGAIGTLMAKTIQFVQDFAEIGEHFDMPVRSYSSGMRSRLAFGISLAFGFDYYLVDEAMSVGDVHFKTKSQEAFRQRIEHSKLILVSHSMNDIKRFCDVVVLIDDGMATLYESVENGISAYKALTPIA